MFVEMDIEVKPRRRYSFFDKLIADEDIPLEELPKLGVVDSVDNDRMNIFSSPPTSTKAHFDIKPSSSEFDNEEYLAYRQLVFQQLAEDNEKEQREVDVTTDDVDSQLHSHTNYESSGIKHVKQHSSDLLPDWDDSDLKSETYSASNHNLLDSKYSWRDPNSQTILSDNLFNCDGNQDQSESKFGYKKSELLLSNWSSFEAQIEKATKAISNDAANTTSSKTEKESIKTRRPSRNSFQRQKLDRELIRKKLSMPDDDEEGENPYGMDRGWPPNRYERSFSNSNQSLQICYINESCSSDDSESPTNNEQPKSTPTSPTDSPYFASPRYGRGYIRHNQSYDSSSLTSSSSTLSSPFNNSENTIIHHHNHHDLHSGRSKHDELELETRYQLAKAHEKAKQQAEEDRKKDKLSRNSSIVHKLLSFSVNEETHEKMKSFNLSRQDCRLMTLGQVQLILNEMHAKKQALNESLVLLLVKRDELKTEQDAKLVDIDDMKAILNSLGPETTV